MGSAPAKPAPLWDQKAQAFQDARTVEHDDNDEKEDVKPASHRRDSAADAEEKSPEPKGPKSLNVGSFDVNTGSVAVRDLMPLQKPNLQVPKVLQFKDTVHVEQSEVIPISNMQSDPIFFKIKVTHPKNFLCRPRSGWITPQDTEFVKVVYKLGLPEPKSKVMVQALMFTSTAGKAELPYETWQRAPKGSLFTQVIRVQFEEELEVDVDLSKFKSVQMTSEKHWWQ